MFKNIYLLTLLAVFLFPCAILAETVSSYSPWQHDDNRIIDKAPQVKTRNTLKTGGQLEKIAQETLPSALENAYSDRLDTPIKQFGYDFFASIAQTEQLVENNAPMGAVQDSFILGTGDTLQIIFTGQRSDQGTYTINSSGMVTIKEFPPIPATGRTIAQLRTAINRHLNTTHNTQAYISLSAVRQIGVLVIGNVKRPGRKNLNIFHTVIDALNLAGGVQKDGSLRQIKLVRGGHSSIIDLYGLLMQGNADIDLRLRDGDRLIIPPIGSTIAVAGAVKRPAIYEVRQHNNKTTKDKLSANELLAFSGGILSEGQNRFIKLALTNDGKEKISRITDKSLKTFGNSTILNVIRSTEKRTGTIELTGHTNASGLYDLSSHKTLSSLLQDKTVFGDDIYPLISVIQRRDNKQLITRFIEFSPRLVSNGKFDTSLQSNDTIILLSNTDISTLYSDGLNNTNKAEGNKNTESKDGYNATIKNDLETFLKERTVSVRGAVSKSGLYPVAQGITLDNILAVAGGLTLDANNQNVEITSKNIDQYSELYKASKNGRATIDLNETDPTTIQISAGDAVRVNQKTKKIIDNTVLIIGEVNHPGHYDLSAGDKVSDLINRAGGMTEQAYPAGAIFSRESERKTEELRFRNSAHNMQRRLAAAIERDDSSPNTTQIEMVRKLADELANIEAVGRITVETDPAILSTRPELDMLLEKNDRIYIPKRPLTVRVNGEVLSPASLQFRKDKNPRNYINEAGGFTYDADKSRAFVLYPDGSAQPLKVSSWNHNPVFVPPGSTIIVPRDPKPFDFIESAKEVGQILSNLAITAVFIDDIRD